MFTIEQIKNILEKREYLLSLYKDIPLDAEDVLCTCAYTNTYLEDDINCYCLLKI